MANLDEHITEPTGGSPDPKYQGDNDKNVQQEQRSENAPDWEDDFYSVFVSM